MLSPEAHVLRAKLMAAKASPPAASIAEFRHRIEALAAPYGQAPAGVEVQPGTVAGLAGEWSRPRAPTPRVVMWLHGGTYVGGSSASHRGLASRLAEASRCPVFTLEYRRAPEHPFPAAVQDAFAAFDELADRHGAGNVIVGGDSAGSALATAVALARRAAGRPLPAALLLLSPWSDLAFTGPSFTDLERQDPWMSGPRLQRSASLYLAGADPRDPRASPLYADWTGFPPTFIQVGSDEILLDDARRLAAVARQAGVLVDLDIGAGLWHVWPLFAARLPEGQAGIQAMADWLTARLGP